MYKKDLNSYTIPAVLFLVAVIVSLALPLLIKTAPTTLPVWLVFVASFFISVLLGVLVFPNVDIRRYVYLGLTIWIIHIASMLIILPVALVMGLQGVLTLDGMTLDINPVALALPVLMSAVIAKFVVDLEQKPAEISASSVVEEKQETPEPVKEETQLEAGVPQEIQPEPVVEEKQEAPEPVKEEIQPEPEVSQEISPEPLVEEKQEVPEPEHKQEPEVIQEAPLQTPSFEPNELKSAQQEPDVAVEKEEELSDLGDLPSLEGDLGSLDETSEEETPAIQEAAEKQDESIQEVPIEKEEDQPVVASVPLEEDLPEVPRLADIPTNKAVESPGKITSIGKLLVDHRDIENIIETNALMQSVGADSTTTNIISAVAGAKINEKLSAITETDGIKSCVVVSESGFIQASTMEDIHKEQVLGAMASGTFTHLAGLLAKVGFQSLKDIAFESDTGALVLTKQNQNIMGVFLEQNIPVYNLNDVNDFLAVAAELEYEGIIDTLSAFDGILGVLISSNTGELLASKLVDDTKNASDIASILPAFYSNLGVFIRNMDQGALRKTIATTPNELVLLTTIGPNILLLYAVLDTVVKPTDKKIQYEAIITS